MSRTCWLGAAALALGAAGCNSGGDAPAANLSANAGAEALENAAAAGNEAAVAAAASGNEAAGNEAAAFPCTFGSDDVRNWKAVLGKDGTRSAGMIIVTGQARTGDDKYKAKLSKTGIEGGTLRLWLTKAEQTDPEDIPEDGWYDLRYGPGETGVSRVAVWCDQDTNLAELEVEGAK